MAIVTPRAQIPVLRRLSFQFLLVCVTVLLLGVLVGGITQILQPVIHRQTLPPDLLIAPLRSSIHPEPVERYSFLVCLLLLPPLLLFLVFSQGGSEPMRRLWIHDRLEFLLVSCTVILLLVPLVSPVAGLRLLDGLIGITGLAVTLIALRNKDWCVQRGQRKYLKIVVLAFSMLCGILVVTNNRIFGFAQVNDSFASWSHLEAVSSAVAQAVAGRSLLVDVPSQYGLFPALLAPWLRFLPDGLMGLTIAFAFLHLISLIALFLMLGRRVNSPLILACASMALVFLTVRSGFSFGASDGSPPDPYFQYYPVRFVAPALSLPVVLWVLKSLSLSRVLALCVWTGICIFWNLDSGVAVLYSVTMLFLLLTGMSVLRPEQRITAFDWRGLLMVTLIIPMGSLSVFAAGLGLLSVSAGAPLNLDWLFLSQSIFYRLGFMMIPMSAWPKLWQSLISLYLISLLIGFSRLRSSHSLNAVAPLLILPLLGAGLFTYYQGRSHDQVFS
jgi:hypothetical protein